MSNFSIRPPKSFNSGPVNVTPRRKKKYFEELDSALFAKKILEPFGGDLKYICSIDITFHNPRQSKDGHLELRHDYRLDDGKADEDLFKQFIAGMVSLGQNTACIKSLKVVTNGDFEKLAEIARNVSLAYRSCTHFEGAPFKFFVDVGYVLITRCEVKRRESSRVTIELTDFDIFACWIIGFGLVITFIFTSPLMHNIANWLKGIISA